MTTLIEKPTAEKTYKEIEKLIYHTCHGFARKYYGDVDEYISNANTIFMKAYDQWDPETCTVSRTTHFRSWIWMGLLDIYRPIWTRLTKHHTIIDQEALENVRQKDKPSFLDMEYLKDSLTQDAYQLLNLLLYAPADLQKIIDGKGGTPRNYRSSVKEYLKLTLNWYQPRVVSAFEELGHHLFGRPDIHTNASALFKAKHRR